jgi:hypothetical protein
MEGSLNIVQLIENNPITKLTNTYNSRLLAKIQNNFTESQQQMFVSSFYCYLNYNPTSDFVVDLDNVWQWLGFQQKYHAKVSLEKHFIVEKDYKCLLPKLRGQTNNEKAHRIRGGHNREQIILTVQTFKLFCIKAGTKKAHEIHEYFVKLETLLHEVLQEETDELKQQLEQKNNEKEEIQNRLIETQEENKLLQTKSKIPMIYIYNTNILLEKPELKIGYTINLHSRIRPYKQVCKHGKVEFTVEVLNFNVRTVENFIHEILKKYSIKDEVFQMEVEEAKMMILRIVNTLKLTDISNGGERQVKLSKLYENELEVMDNQPREKKSTCEIGTQTDEYFPNNIVITNSEQIDEKTQSFEKFISEHCIVRTDVEVATTDIIGQYRIITQKCSKEMYHSFKNYLDTKFKPARLKHQNEKNVVMGYQGITLREIEYKKSVEGGDVQNFIYHACVFSPSGKSLFADILEEYKKWKKNVQKPETGNEEQEIKKYLKHTEYTVYTTIWAKNGGGQGYYGIFLKKEMEQIKTTSSTGKKVEKRMIDTNELLGTWETIAKAAEAEQICAAKMSRSIKSRTIFQGDYYFCNSAKN